MSAVASRILSSTSAKLPWYSRVSHGAARSTSRKYSATLGSRSQAMKRPSLPRRSAIAAAWPPAPKVQSIATSPDAGRSSSTSSSRRTGVCASTISYSLSRKLVSGCISPLLQLGQVLAPGGAVPDLDVVLDSDDGRLPADAGELQQPRREGHSALAVRLLED